MLFSISPLLTSVGILGFILLVGIVALILVDRTPQEHDAERASRLLTLKLRQPLKYQIARWIER